MKNITGILMLLVMLAGAWGIWEWGFCRFYVRPDEMAVITAKIGQPLAPGQILARKGQKGIQEDVLGEGRYFRNPFLYARDIVPVTVIAPGKVGIVTSKVGTELPPGEFLAEPGQKGIWRRILGPGKYRLNPHGYRVDVVDAVNIPVGFVGVMTSLSGDQAPAGSFAQARQKGVRQDILQPGLYFINPKELTVDILEVGVNQVSLLGAGGGQVIAKRQMETQNVAAEELQQSALQDQKVKRDKYLAQAQALRAVEDKLIPPAPLKPGKGMPVPAKVQPISRSQHDESLATFVVNQVVEFPSRDGFEIFVHMTTEFELLPEKIAAIFRGYGDLPAVVDKIILPQILSVSRLQGSMYRATDFILGDGREKFQDDLKAALAVILKEKGIVVHDALIRTVNVPMQILDPIQQASVAIEQDLTNKEMQHTAQKQADLNTELGLIDQRRGQVAQETEKLRAEIKADQEKKVAETRAEAVKRVAEIDKETAGVRAEKTRKLGEAEAKVIRMVEGERANGHVLKAQAFGDPVAYSLWELANRLNDDVEINIFHAGPGTLWTDLEKARLGDLGAAAILEKKPKPESPKAK